MKTRKLSLKSFSALTKDELLAWRRLVALQPNIQRAFLSPTFCSVASSINPDIRVLVFYDDNGPLGFLPLQERRGWLRWFGVHEPAGGQMTDYFGLVAAPLYRVDVPDALNRARINAIEFTHLDETQAEAGLTGANPRIGLRTIIGESGTEYWDKLKSSNKTLVSDTNRSEHKLAAEHGALTFAIQSKTAESDLAALIKLTSAQYQLSGNRHAPLFDERNIELLHRLLQSTDPQCTGLLSVLRVNGEFVAAHFGLQCYDQLHYWFPVYDARYKAYAPGRLLFKNIILQSAEKGIRVIDRGEGDSAMKRDFTNEHHQFYRGVWYRNGIQGLVARGAISLSWRLPLLDSARAVPQESIVKSSDDPREALIQPQSRNGRHSRAAPVWRGELKAILDLSESELLLWRSIQDKYPEYRSPFFAPDFSQAVAKSRTLTSVCLLYFDGTLRGFFPFQFQNVFAQYMHAAERIGGELNDFSGVILDRSACGSLSPSELLDCAGLNHLSLSHLEQSQPQLGLMATTPRSGARITLREGAGAYWTAMKKEHQRVYNNLKNRERKIEKDFDSVTFILDHDKLDEMAKLVIERKREQYIRNRVDDVLLDPWKQKTLENLRVNASVRCRPIVSVLELNGVWAAMHLGLHSLNGLHYWFPVYNPDFRAYSPGLVLLKKIIDAAPSHDIHEIDLGEGSSQYKEWFGNEYYDNFQAMWYSGLLRSTLYRLRLSVSWRFDAFFRKVPPEKH